MAVGITFREDDEDFDGLEHDPRTRLECLIEARKAVFGGRFRNDKRTSDAILKAIDRDIKGIAGK